MHLKFAKLQRRAKLIVGNSLNNLILMAFGPLVSFLVIRLASIDLWGTFVNVLIIVQLGTHIVAWGNKEYLLRAFSLKPAEIAEAWQSSFLSRFLLFAGFCLVMAFMFPLKQVPLIILWGLGLVLSESCAVLVLYRKDFIFSAVVEAVTLGALVGGIVWLGETVNLNHLLWLFMLANLVKGLILIIWFYPYTLSRVQSKVVFGFAPKGSITLNYFSLAFSFFLLGFSGMLNSRIDLYCVNYFLPKEQVGQYQVFSNFLIYIQSISAFILMPFVKSIYRLDYKGIIKMASRLFVVGVFITIPAMGTLHLILIYFYHIQLSIAFLIVGGVYILPIYFYLPLIYGLYRANLQTIVLKTIMVALTITFVFNLILLPTIGMIGAIIASAIAKWVVLFIYLSQRKAIKTVDSGQ